MIILNTEYHKFKELKGIFSGGCIERGEGSRFHAKAHTHLKGKYKDWICVLKPSRVYEDRMLMLHEVAHVLTHCGHVDKWRAKLLEIGGTLDPVPNLLKSYHKRERR